MKQYEINNTIDDIQNELLNDLYYLEELTYPTQYKVWTFNKGKGLATDIKDFSEFRNKCCKNDWLIDINDYMII